MDQNATEMFNSEVAGAVWLEFHYFALEIQCKGVH